VALNGLGQAYEGIGKRDVALDNYAQASRLFLANGSLDFAASSEYRVARIFRLTGDDQRALDHYHRCVALSRRANKRRMEAYALTDIAAVYHARGGRGETLRQYQDVLSLYRMVGDRRGQALVLDNLGDLASESGDRRKALTFYRRALPLARASGDREAEVSTLYDAALAARDAGDLEAALRYAEQSVGLVETLRAYATGPDLRASYFASVRRHYDLYVDLLMRLDRRSPGRGYAAASLLASEHARARSLLEVVAEGGADVRRGVEPRLLERERTLQQMLVVKARQRIELSGDEETRPEAEEAERELRELTAEYQVLQAQMREQSPLYASLTQPEPVSLEEIQAELRGENTALLEYALGDEKSYLWVVTENSLDGYELPGRVVIETRAREVYGLLTSRQPGGGGIDAAYQAGVAISDEVYEEKALALSRMLLGPANAHLGGRRLLIAAEGVLQYIPFDALPVAEPEPAGGWPELAAGEPAGRPLLVSRHEVVNIPSMSALIGLRRKRPRVEPAASLVAILADPVYEANDQRVSCAGQGILTSVPCSDPARGTRLNLRGTEMLDAPAGIPRLRRTSDEAEAIMSLVPSGQGVLEEGFRASRETAVSPDLGHYRIIHFAAHGLVNSEHPELSGIMLSLVNREGGHVDGFLQLHDIYNLNLSAELVVLSACNTGLGEDVKGEGIVGLTRAFLHAGSKGVVSSLWKVDDAATAELMRRFYGAMLKDGLPPAAALRYAKESVRRQKRWRAPYYWAGFVLQGEYRQRLRADDPSHPVALVVTLTIFLVCLVCAGLYILSKRPAISAPRTAACGPSDSGNPEAGGRLANY
jgi:CHAT domain-containing protein